MQYDLDNVLFAEMLERHMQNNMISLQTAHNLIGDFKNNALTTWKSAFELYKKRVHRTGKHIFVQEVPSHHMVQLTYLHPQVTKNMTPGDVRAVTKFHNHSSITIHVPTNSLVHCFGTRAYIYQNCDNDLFVQETEQFAQEPETISMQVNPLGIVVAVRWWQDKWLFGSATMAVANSATFGSDSPLELEFRRIYSNNSQDEQDPLNALDRSLIHIFRISSSKYIPFGVKDQITLLETRYLDGKVAQSFQFQDATTVPKAEVMSQLQAIAKLTLDDHVLNIYKSDCVLIGSVLVKMGRHLIQLESQMQEAANQCVMNHINTKVKQSLAEFVQTIESPLLSQLTEVFKERIVVQDDKFEVVDCE